MAGLGAEDLDQVYHFAVQLGKDTGKMLLDARSGHGLRANHIEKESSVDLVTQTDESK